MKINTKLESIVSRQKYTKQEKLAAMKVIESNGGSVILASKELGVHKTTLFKWKAELWEEFLENRQEVNNHIVTVEARKMMLFAGTEKITNKSVQLYEKAIDFFLSDDDEGVCNFDKRPSKEKVQLVNVIAPYVMEKRAVLGVKDQTPAQNNNFFANIYYQLKNGQNGEYINTIQGDSAAIAISE
jgi:transposase-like protein